MGQRSLNRDALVIRRWIRGVIEERGRCRNGVNDLLGALLVAVDPTTGTSFTAEELVDQICFLFLAGREPQPVPRPVPVGFWLWIKLRSAVLEVLALPEALTHQSLSFCVMGLQSFRNLAALSAGKFFIRERINEDTNLSVSSTQGSPQTPKSTVVRLDLY